MELEEVIKTDAKKAFGAGFEHRESSSSIIEIGGGPSADERADDGFRDEEDFDLKTKNNPFASNPFSDSDDGTGRRKSKQHLQSLWANESRAKKQPTAATFDDSD